MYAIFRMGIPGGNVAVEELREMMVTSKLDWRRAAVMGRPKLPDA